MDYKYCDSNCPYNTQNIFTFTKARARDKIQPIDLEFHGSKTLLVFEAPGYYEWIKNRPIHDSRDEQKMDSAGSRIATAFEACNKQRNNYDIAEAVCCFPGKQKDLNHNEIVNASMSCRKYLYGHVQAKRYSKIVCWGHIAYSSILDIVDSIRVQTPQYCPTIISLKHPTAKDNNQDAINNDVRMYL